MTVAQGKGSRCLRPKSRDKHISRFHEIWRYLDPVDRDFSLDPVDRETWKILILWTVTPSLVEAFHATFYSLHPHQLLWVTMVEPLSSWSYVVLPCWLTVRHPSRSEPEMPINGGVPRLFFYSWGNQMTYHAAQTPRPQG